MHILLETDRLILRRFTEADVDHLFALDNDPEVMRYINGGTPTPREVIEIQILPEFMRYDEQRPAFGFWAVDARQTGEFLGWLCFRPKPEDPHEVVLGYRFRKTAWGKGFATEGARAIINKGFAELAVRRVVATTYEKNVASRRVMEKLGMVFTRAFRLTADDIASSDTAHTTSDEVWDGDDVEYVLERSDWVERKIETSNKETMMSEYIPSTSAWVAEQVELYEGSGGVEGNTLRETGLPVIIVTNRGHKTGAIRKTPLMRVADGENYILIASQGGAPQHPAWYHNLKADPNVEIRDRTDVYTMRVREIEDAEERKRLWGLAVEAFPPYQTYQESTERTIPVFVAEPVS